MSYSTSNRFVKPTDNNQYKETLSKRQQLTSQKRTKKTEGNLQIMNMKGEDILLMLSIVTR